MNLKIDYSSRRTKQAVVQEPQCTLQMTTALMCTTN